MGILCLADICTDRSTASAYLVRDDILRLSFRYLTRLMIRTAKSIDCVLSLLSDITTLPVILSKVSFSKISCKANFTAPAT